MDKETERTQMRIPGLPEALAREISAIKSRIHEARKTHRRLVLLAGVSGIMVLGIIFVLAISLPRIPVPPFAVNTCRDPQTPSLDSDCWTLTPEALQMPADVTRIPLHSHNDYWRSRPLFDALAVGARSFEADVWVSGHSEDLLVGHRSFLLRNSQTLNRLYLDNLYLILNSLYEEKRSPQQENLRRIMKSRFQTDLKFAETSDETEFLLLDIKNAPNESLDLILRHLQRFADKGYLSYYDYDDQKMYFGPITVVLTGEFPLEKIINEHSHGKRYFTVDAPLSQAMEMPSVYRELSVMVSGSMRKLLSGGSYFGTFKHRSASEVVLLKDRVRKAQSEGFIVRIWDVPEPVGSRETYWRVLLEDVGEDLLNADDLFAASPVLRSLTGREREGMNEW